LVVIPKKKPSILRTVSKYFCNSSSLAFKLFLIWPKMTWESVLITTLHVLWQGQYDCFVLYAIVCALEFEPRCISELDAGQQG
jgi:hypothetical protein